MVEDYDGARDWIQQLVTQDSGYVRQVEASSLQLLIFFLEINSIPFRHISTSVAEGPSSPWRT
jgi:hypothetical protein